MLLALQILNLSVQSRPANDSNDGFMLSHSTVDNPVDNAIEYIVERVMNFKNAFPEYGKQSHQDPMQFNKTASFNLYFAYYNIYIEKIYQPLVLMHQDIYKEGYHYLFASEINPPPPKA